MRTLYQIFKQATNMSHEHAPRLLNTWLFEKRADYIREHPGVPKTRVSLSPDYTLEFHMWLEEKYPARQPEPRVANCCPGCGEILSGDTICKRCRADINWLRDIV